MTIYRWSAEGGVANTEVTVPNAGGASGHAPTQINKGTSGSIKYQTAAKIHGDLGVEIIQGSNEVADLRFDFEDSTRVHVIWYMKIPAVPTADYSFGQIRPSSGAFFSTQVRQSGSPTGRFRMVQPGGTSSSSTAALPQDGTALRFEVLAQLSTTGQVNGAVDFGYYLGDNLSEVQKWNLTGLDNAATGTSPLNRFHVGRTSGASVDDTHVKLDSVQILTGVHAVALGVTWPADPPAPNVLGGGVIRVRQAGAWT